MDLEKRKAKEQLLLAILKPSHDVEIINPDHVIAHLTAGGKLDMQIKVEWGRGYVPGTCAADCLQMRIRTIGAFSRRFFQSGSPRELCRG